MNQLAIVAANWSTDVVGIHRPVLVSSGPPIYSPFKQLDSVANLGEMFIHHEDVRRAIDGWQPRVLDASIATPLRRQLGLMSRMMLGKLPAQVELRTPAGDRIARVGRGDAVTVTGEPLGWTLPLAVVAGLGAAFVLERHAVRRLGGITGDVLGALAEVAVTVTLVVAAMGPPA